MAYWRLKGRKSFTEYVWEIFKITGHCLIYVMLSFLVAIYVNIFGLSQLGALVFAPIFGIIVGRQSTLGNNYECFSPSRATEKAHQKFMMGIEYTTKAVEFIINCNKEKIHKLNDAILVTACSAILFCLLTLVPNLHVQVRPIVIFKWSAKSVISKKSRFNNNLTSSSRN